MMALDTVDLDGKGPIANKKAQDHVARIQTIDREVHERLRQTRQYAEKHFNKKVREQATLLVPEAYAWLCSEGITMPWDKARKCKKLRAKYYGPYKILDQISPVTYRLDLPPQSKIHDVFHVALLKPVHGSDLGGGRREHLPDHHEEQEYVVEAITAQRERNGEKQYLVKWEGYMYEDSTWEPIHHLENCPDKLGDFEKRLRKEDGRSRHDIVETLEQYKQSGI